MESTQRTVGFVAHDFTAAVVGQLAGPPCADARDVDSTAVSFVLNVLLDSVLAPHVQALCLIAFGFSATKIKVLKNDAIYRMQHGKIYNGRGYFLCQFVVQAACIFPEGLYVLRAMFPLVTSDAVKHVPQMVFFTGEVDKLPCQNSSIGGHDTANRIGV